LLQLAANNENIVFTGSVMGIDKEVLLENCFVNCLVSSSEGMPISLLEAMVHNKPCIVSDIPAIREIMPQGSAHWCAVGDVDNIAQCMNYIENNPSSINVDSEDMLQYVRNNHAWEKISERYASYIKSL
jgi:glycosyltransferase involved in cell wall biosynthesis